MRLSVAHQGVEELPRDEGTGFGDTEDEPVQVRLLVVKRGRRDLHRSQRVQRPARIPARPQQIDRPRILQNRPIGPQCPHFHQHRIPDPHPHQRAPDIDDPAGRNYDLHQYASLMRPNLRDAVATGTDLLEASGEGVQTTRQPLQLSIVAHPLRRKLVPPALPLLDPFELLRRAGLFRPGLLHLRLRLVEFLLGCKSLRHQLLLPLQLPPRTSEFGLGGLQCRTLSSLRFGGQQPGRLQRVDALQIRLRRPDTGLCQGDLGLKVGHVIRGRSGGEVPEKLAGGDRASWDQGLCGAVPYDTPPCHCRDHLCRSRILPHDGAGSPLVADGNPLRQFDSEGHAPLLLLGESHYTRPRLFLREGNPLPLDLRLQFPG